jgi:hypothetical protein
LPLEGSRTSGGKSDLNIPCLLWLPSGISAEKQDAAADIARPPISGCSEIRLDNDAFLN